DAEAPASPLKPRVRLLLITAGISGFLGLSFEVVWFRTLILVFGSTTYSFSTMLAIFLLGISVGAIALGWISDKVKHPALLFGMCATGIGIYSLTSLYWFNSMPEWLLQHLATYGFSWENMISAKFIMAFKFLFIPALLFGISFTAVTKAVRILMPSRSRTIGDVSAFNTIGAAIGAIAAGFVILPLLGMEMSIIVLSFAAIALGTLLVATEPKLKWNSRIPVIATGAICMIVIILFTPKWEKTLLAAGPYFSPWMYVQNGEITLNKKLQSERLLFFKEGRTSTISTVKDANEVIFFSSNGKVEADTAKRSMTLQRMMGHLPMLFHPNPKQVMNIGLGAGVTFGSLGCRPVEHLEVVEIEPEVKNVAMVWGDLNHRIVERDDAIITINDGRNHLFATSRKYDVITSDPFEPVMAGAGNLYTIEHFEQAKRCLAKGGIMAQFLPMYELSKEDYLIIARSFTHVFPRTVLFFTGYDTVLVGFTDDANIDLKIAQKNYQIPAVKRSLSEIGFTSAEMILGMFVANLADNDVIGNGTLNTDNHPVIEFSAPRSTLHYTPDINMQTLLDIFSPIPEELAKTLTQEQLAQVTAEHQALQKTLQASIAKVKGDGEKFFQLLQEAMQLTPNNPVIKNEMVLNLVASADNLRMGGDPANAWMQYQIALQFQP
ncbi:MAG: fused MFS/spermidine synthase, partial [Kiritimatiellae bacterium]|nr:fused MFS/spermidine synthase [Kiritimatiellia bacterium]